MCFSFSLSFYRAAGAFVLRRSRQTGTAAGPLRRKTAFSRPRTDRGYKNLRGGEIPCSWRSSKLHFQNFLTHQESCGPKREAIISSSRAIFVFSRDSRGGEGKVIVLSAAGIFGQLWAFLGKKSCHHVTLSSTHCRIARDPINTIMTCRIPPTLLVSSTDTKKSTRGLGL